MNKKFIKPLVMVIAALLVVILAAGLIAQTVIKNKKTVESGTPPTIEKTVGKVYDGDGQELEQGKIYKMPTAMLFSTSGEDAAISPFAVSAPSATVSVSQSFKYNNVKIDWDSTYEDGTDASSAVKVTPLSDGSLDAKVECLTPFSKPILINAMLRNNHDNKASCHIDYIKRISSSSFGNLMGTDFGDGNGFEIKPTFGVGTVAPDVYLSSLLAYLDSDFESNVKSLLTFDIAFTSYKLNNIKLSGTEGGYYVYDDSEWKYSDFIDGYDNYDAEHQTAIKYAWFNGWNNCSEKYRTIYLDYDVRAVFGDISAGGISESEIRPNYCYLSGECDADGLQPVLSLNSNIAF